MSIRFGVARVRYWSGLRTGIPMLCGTSLDVCRPERTLLQGNCFIRGCSRHCGLSFGSCLCVFRLEVTTPVRMPLIASSITQEKQ